MNDNVSQTAPRSVWIALILLAAVPIGTAAGWLAHAGGATAPASILTGGGAFAGAVLLFIAVHQFSTSDRR
jgi:predicted branched-subunit amino acid permease